MYAQILLVSIKFDMNDKSYFLSCIQQNEISYKFLLLLHINSNNKDDDRNSEASQIFIIYSILYMYFLFEA